ncbi:MAG: hypothetical protein WD873_03830 [Candidatus Hydrogenedentales bacterium]
MAKQETAVNFDLLENIQSTLSEIKRSGEPGTFKFGDQTFVIQDIDAYNKLLDVVDEIETLKSIESGIRDFEEGRFTPYRKLKKKWEARLNSFR